MYNVNNTGTKKGGIMK